MESIKRRLLGLCVPPVAFCVLDASLTLCGQSEDYWGGDYATVNELSPSINQLLQIHPAAFAVGLVAWIALLVGIILLLPDTLALIVSIAVTFGHTAGAATWLLYRHQFGYQLCNALFLLSATTLGLGIRWGWQASPSRAPHLKGWPPVLRWGLAAALFGIAVYLFVWPRSI